MRKLALYFALMMAAHAPAANFWVAPPKVEIPEVSLSTNALGGINISTIAIWRDGQGNAFRWVTVNTNDNGFAAIYPNYPSQKALLQSLIAQSCTNLVFVQYPATGGMSVTVPHLTNAPTIYSCQQLITAGADTNLWIGIVGQLVNASFK